MSDWFEPEFYDVEKVMKKGAVKHGRDTWMNSGPKTDHESMHNSMFHHLSESWTGQVKDKESGLHPLLHLACRALMYFTIQKRGSVFIDCPSYPTFQVNTLGQVKKNSRPVKGSVMSIGYRKVSCYRPKPSATSTLYVHDLMADAWLGAKPEGYQVNHKDGDKLNNHRDNLEYVTPSENIQHAYNTGLLKPYDRHGENHPGSKLNLTMIKKAITMKQKGLTYTDIAKEFQVSRHTISRALNGKTYTIQKRNGG